MCLRTLLLNSARSLKKKAEPIHNISQDREGLIRTGGIIQTIKKIITRTGEAMLFVTLADLSDKIEVVVFPKILKKNPLVWQEDKIILLTGYCDIRGGSLKLICQNAKELIKTKNTN